MTDKNHLSFLYLVDFLKWVQGLIRQKVSLDDGIKFDASGVYFKPEIQSNIYCDQTDNLQWTFTDIIIFILMNVYI